MGSCVASRAIWQVADSTPACANVFFNQLVRHEGKVEWYRRNRDGVLSAAWEGTGLRNMHKWF
jgi:hypothetical protein